MCEPSTSAEEFDLDQWESELVKECPELANFICVLDEVEEKKVKETTVSKKQEKRDRVARLAEMMTEGRPLFESSADCSRSGKWKTVLENMASHNNGPLSLLSKAVVQQKAVEVRTRSVNRIDRVFVGTPMSFDYHMNIAMRNVRETMLLGRQAQREVGERNRLNQLLPEFLRWKDGGEWPIEIGKNRILQHRDQRACLIKGDNVVLVRLL